MCPPASSNSPFLPDPSTFLINTFRRTSVVPPRLSTGLFDGAAQDAPLGRSFRACIKKHRLRSNPHGISIGIEAIHLLDRCVIDLEQLVATN